MKPVVAETFPIRVDMKEGQRYSYCTCRKSEKHPFCDGAHKGTEFKPLIYIAEKTEKKFWCQCKHTKKPPFCDGAHSDI